MTVDAVRAAGKIVNDEFGYKQTSIDEASKDESKDESMDENCYDACAKFSKTSTTHSFTSRANRGQCAKKPASPSSSPTSTSIVDAFANSCSLSSSIEAQIPASCYYKLPHHSCLSDCVPSLLRYAVSGTVPCPYYYLRSIIHKQVWGIA